MCPFRNPLYTSLCDGCHIRIAELLKKHLTRGTTYLEFALRIRNLDYPDSFVYPQVL